MPDDSETLKERLSRWFHHKKYRYSIPGRTAKFVLEGSYWTILWVAVTSVGVLLPMPLLNDVGFLSTSHLLTALGIGGVWMLSEWCSFTHAPEDL